jgi:hypothetical protein
MDKENSNYAFKVVREATIRADIDAKGLSIPHTLETSGYRPDGELSKFASGKYVRCCTSIIKPSCVSHACLR